MKKRIPYLLLPLITLILEILPYGAVCNFATETRRIRELYSYFDLTPYGYANFAPFLTALLTCIIFGAACGLVLHGQAANNDSRQGASRRRSRAFTLPAAARHRLLFRRRRIDHLDVGCGIPLGLFQIQNAEK